MKYCLRCGKIWSDSSCSADENYCDNCGNKDIKEDDMTSKKYELLSEEEKDQYELELFQLIKNSEYFDERFIGYQQYGTPNFYYYFRYDKYEQMTGKKAGRAWTPEEEEAFRKQCQEKYGPESEAYKKCLAEYVAEANKPKEPEKPKAVHCPNCNSTNVVKISKFEKAMDIEMLGVWALDDVTKTYKCKTCWKKF